MKRIIFAVLCGALIGASLGLLTAQQPEPVAAQPDNAPVSGDAAAGEVLFFGRASCANCHDVNGRGGIAGPEPG